MTHDSRLDRRRKGRLRARGFLAIFGTLMLALALAACGSSNSSSSSASGGASASGGSTATNAASPAASGGVAAAQTQLQKYEAAPTQITIQTPLKSAPPK